MSDPTAAADIQLLKNYFASLPASDRIRLANSIITCQCVVCRYILAKMGPNL